MTEINNYDSFQHLKTNNKSKIIQTYKINISENDYKIYSIKKINKDKTFVKSIDYETLINELNNNNLLLLFVFKC